MMKHDNITRIMGLLEPKVLMGMACLMGLMTLVGCTDDESEPTWAGAQVELMPMVSRLTEVEAVTRAHPAWAPTGYELYEDLVGSSGQMTPNTRADIGAFFTKDDNAPLARSFTVNAADKWFIQDEAVPADDYFLYGFVPYDACTATISGYDNTTATFSNGAQMTLTGLPSVANKDVCVMVGAKHGSDANTVTGTLAPGDFGLTLNSGHNNYLFLLFDHIYAALSFKFRLSNEAPYYYASLRHIKLKKLELRAYSDADCLSPLKSRQSTTITLQANNSGTSPIVGPVTFTPDASSGDIGWVTIHDSEVSLPSGTYASGEHAGEYIFTESLGFVPSISSYFILRSTFDVYDLDDEGNPGTLIRRNCKSDNKIDPSTLFNLSTLDRGKIYTLRLTVKPTYLYVLSDPDLDNPTITVE